MNRTRRIRPIRVLAALAAVVLLVATLPALAVATQAPTAGIKAAARDRAKQLMSVIQDRNDMQADREAAAARLAAMQVVADQNAALIGGLKPSLVATPGPGGIPDCFGTTPNWAFSPPLRKFVDTLPGLGAGAPNNLGQYIPVGKPDTKTYPGCDYYVIEVRQYTQQMHSDLPPTTLRGYVQTNQGTDGAGNNTLDPEPIHYLGPIIVAQKNRPVRVKFVNKLPTGVDGNLFIPVDTTIMGAGMGPKGMAASPMNYTQNRATLHLHGGRTPWISDGTPHQWITPAGENTPYPKGVSVSNVPDMPDPGPGAQTFFYSNQQSARMMFYHDHAMGITRLNVYSGEAAGYLIQDAAEKKLVDDGVIPADEIPLIIQDKTFVDASTIATTDPTWNWGTTAPVPHTGDLWYPHVYVPAQNPFDASGVNPTGRWHYAAWFWPPAKNLTHPPIPNPYYDPQLRPWEPPFMPATPNPSMPGESFMDTPIVNGTAFPSVTVQPKSYRLRMLNAANDRFWNLQMYEADGTRTSSDGRTDTEVKMVPAAPTASFPEGWPTDGRDGGVPDPSTVGPDWIQIGTEGGFLPAPAVIPNQPIDWNTDPTTFNMGNVSSHSLLLAPAERADVVVDFSKYAGKTLIVYNDAPAAFPALDARYDYYTDAPDLTETGGHPGPKAGFGPNTRTIMQIKVAAAPAAPAFDVTKLEDAFKSTDTTQGVFAASQDPILVGQSGYDSAYNKTFPTRWPDWGLVNIQDNEMTFKTLTGSTLTLPLEPKAIQDEMGEAFDTDYGRMSGKLGVEMPQTAAGAQNFLLFGYIDPATEDIQDSMTPMSPVAGDGTQIWKITHNGVDTHPIHFHLFDVQLINRVGWDGAIRKPDSNELGWKDTVRVSPLEDTIVALRPTSMALPFKIPDSVRPLDPTMPLGSTVGFANVDPKTGNPLTIPVVNKLVNFGWEYVWHCHILSHEEMDMMRPVSFRVSPAAPSALKLGPSPYTLPQKVAITWTNNFKKPVATNQYIERATNPNFTGTVATFTVGANATSFTDTTLGSSAFSVYYRVRSENSNSYSAWSNTIHAVSVTSVSIKAPTTMNRYATGKISGLIKPAFAGGQVTIFMRTPTSFTYTLLKTVPTDAGGAWSRTFTPTIRGTYRFYAMYGPIKSPTVLVTVR
jgi:FtsP/CotA-like multicopper oxidase with cupredoxin domain